jgi:hypothetical protein
MFFEVSFLVVVVGVLFAQDLRVVVFWVLFCVCVVVLGLFGSCCGCGSVFTSWLSNVRYWLFTWKAKTIKVTPI